MAKKKPWVMFGTGDGKSTLALEDGTSVAYDFPLIIVGEQVKVVEVDEETGEFAIETPRGDRVRGRLIESRDAEGNVYRWDR